MIEKGSAPGGGGGERSSSSVVLRLEMVGGVLRRTENIQQIYIYVPKKKASESWKLRTNQNSATAKCHRQQLLLAGMCCTFTWGRIVQSRRFEYLLRQKQASACVKTAPQKWAGVLWGWAEDGAAQQSWWHLLSCSGLGDSAGMGLGCSSGAVLREQGCGDNSHQGWSCWAQSPPPFCAGSSQDQLCAELQGKEPLPAQIWSCGCRHSPSLLPWLLSQPCLCFAPVFFPLFFFFF